MCPSPVTYENSVKIPLFFKNPGKTGVVAAVLVIEEIVGTHHRPGAAFLYGCAESRQINLVQSPVADNHVGGVAVQFLIVERKMFYARGHTLFLNALDIGNDHRRGEGRILPHILKIPST